MGLLRLAKLIKRKRRGDTPERRGRVGERNILNTIKTYSFRYRVYHHLISNYTFYTPNGRSHQIDAIYINHNGVFVIEIKNWEGYIHGGENDHKWLRKYGKYTYAFHNPLIQNKGHINALRNIINDVPYYSLVVFYEGNLSNVHAPNVVNERGLGRYLENFKSDYTFSPEIIDQIYEKLLENRANISNREHIKNINNSKRV